MEEEALWAAYRATEFRARTHQGEVRIRIGERCPLLDELLEQMGVDAWVFVTAWNPASRRLASDQNEERNRALRADLAELDCSVFEGVGQPLEGDWVGEASFLVLGMGRAQSVELGRRHGQNAVVWGSRGRVPELVDCRQGPSR